MFLKPLNSLLAAAAVLGLTASFAAADQPPCGRRDQIISVLGEKYNENRQSIGLVGQDGKGIIELFVSDKGTWTMLMTTAKGNTCIVAAGLGWREEQKKIAGAGI